MADGNVSEKLQGAGFPGLCLGLGFRGYGNTTLPVKFHLPLYGIMRLHLDCPFHYLL